MNEFQLQVESSGEWLILRLTGEASADHLEPLRRQFHELISQEPTGVVFDLSHLTFISSVTLGLLIEFRHDLRTAGSELRLAGASPRITKIFQETRLAEIFPMYDTPDHAIDA